jgi:hypothetical protein
MGGVLGEIERDQDLTTAASALQLDDDERAKTLDLLNGEIYRALFTRCRSMGAPGPA